MCLSRSQRSASCASARRPALLASPFRLRASAAKVTEISQRAEFTPKDVQTKEERVKQVFAVKLVVENPEGVLKPGMPADARIFWKGGARSWAPPPPASRRAG